MDELEALLRQFQPRRPAPLPEIARLGRLRWPVWIAAAGLAAAVIMVARYERKPIVEDGSVDSVTLGALNAHAFTSLEDLDDVLTRLSRTTLPDIEHPGGALKALSKE